MNMNISTFKKVLPALRIIAAPSGKKPNERALEIGALDNTLVIRADDMSTYLELTASGVDTSNFDGRVNFDKFNTLLGALKSMPSFDYETGALVLRSGKRTIKLDSDKLERVGAGARSFKASAGDGLQWDVSRLTEGLEYISTAISNDDTRFHLNGVLLAKNGDMVAADGHRLHLYSYHYSDNNAAPFFMTDDPDTIIPKHHVKMIKAAIKACGGNSAEVYSTRGVICGSRHLRFVVEGNGISFKITCRLIDSRFPSYQAVIPKGHETRAVVNVLDFTAATKLLTKMMGDSRHKAVAIRLDGQLHLKGGDLTEILDAPYEGEGFEYGELGANSMYLSDAASLPGEFFDLEFGKGLDPIKLSQGAFLGVVMPHRV